MDRTCKAIDWIVDSLSKMSKSDKPQLSSVKNRLEGDLKIDTHNYTYNTRYTNSQTYIYL